MQITDLPKHQAPVCAVTFSSTLDHAVSASKDGAIHVSELATGRELWSASVAGVPTCVAVAPGLEDKSKDIAVGTHVGGLTVFRKVRPVLKLPTA